MSFREGYQRRFNRAESPAIRPDELSKTVHMFVSRVIILVIVWFVFKDVIDAPTWACWAVTVNINFTMVNGEWLTLLAKRTAHESPKL